MTDEIIFERPFSVPMKALIDALIYLAEQVRVANSIQLFGATATAVNESKKENSALWGKKDDT